MIIRFNQLKKQKPHLKTLDGLKSAYRAYICFIHSPALSSYSVLKSSHILLTSSPASSVTYLSQLAEDNAEVFLLNHLLSDGIQVVSDGGGTEAAVELVYVVVVEGESFIADSHLGDCSYSAFSH